MFKQTRMVVIVLALAIALAYCDRPQQAPADGAANRSAVRETTSSTAAPKAKNAAPDHPGHLAVVDLNKIAEDIGHRAKIEKAREIREMNLQTSVRVLQENVQAKLEKLAGEIGERPRPKGAKPTDAEQELIIEWISKKQKLEQARIETGERVRQAYEQQRQTNQEAIRADIRKMRGRIAPLAQRIAKDKGLDVVVTSSSVLARSKAVDITADVFKEVNELLKAGNFPTVSIPMPLKVVRQPEPRD
jgi:Skp family chaperone for outer membrane proteins